MTRVIKKIDEKEFLHIVSLINRAKEKALLSVNVELINLYWNIGNYISNKIKNADWGESVVRELAEYISKKHPNLKGYSDKNLWRMRQFYETYSENKKLSPLVRQLSWSNHLLILSKTKSMEEKIELLEEYKKSLIHHVVTGKVDVRDVVA